MKIFKNWTLRPFGKEIAQDVSGAIHDWSIP